MMTYLINSRRKAERPDAQSTDGFVGEKVDLGGQPATEEDPQTSRRSRTIFASSFGVVVSSHAVFNPQQSTAQRVNEQ